MAARYGSGSPRGRRVVGEDAPLYEPIDKGYAGNVRAAYRAMPTTERRIMQAQAAGAATGVAAMPLGYRQGKKDGRAGGVGAARAITRGALLPGYNYGRLKARRERKAGVGKGLMPTMGQLKTGAKIANTNGRVAASLGMKAATATPKRKVATAAAGGALAGAAMTGRPAGAQQPIYVAPYSQGFGKAYRRYDPERNRQRRAGATEATLAIGGGYAAHRGVRGIQRDTKELRATKIRGEIGSKDTTIERKVGRKALAVSRRNGALLAGGLAGIAAAGGVGHWQNSNRGRTYR